MNAIAGSGENSDFHIGVVGLGVMGRNLLLNISDHGFAGAGYDKDAGKVEALGKESSGRSNIRWAGSPEEFVRLLARPRSIILLVPAGSAVDAVIGDLLPFLDPGDLIVDGGNSHFKDTDRREKSLREKDMFCLGVGISGGEKGARYGPSIMPGGMRQAYERIRPVFEAAAARVDGAPCVTYLGPHSAGHYVKMVHNGIEYGLMELIAESYDLMRRGLGMNNNELHAIFDLWNHGDTGSFLLEITAAIFRHPDDRTDGRLIDSILDEARQKGTGAWTSMSAMELEVPIPTIDAAVAVRSLSVLKEQRGMAAKRFEFAPQYGGDRPGFLKNLHDALYAAMILTYSQGMALLATASRSYEYNLNLEAVARIWRGGCIIRAALLEKIMQAFRARPDLPNLLLDGTFVTELKERHAALREVVRTASALGIPAPALMMSLSYFDGYRSGRLPANLIQAQRDYFGSHTYQRIDAEGVFHTQWESE